MRAAAAVTRGARGRAVRGVLLLALAALPVASALALQETSQTGTQGAQQIPAATAPWRLLVVGDSLSAEYGLPRGSGWVELMRQRLDTPEGRPPQRKADSFEVINASISGDTTAGGLSRFPALLARHKPQLTVIELGANDALRGLPLDGAQANLERMVTLAHEAGSRVVLLGMQMPPNFGADHAERFVNMYQQIATRHRLPAPPFLLKGFEADLDAFQSDRIHPSRGAQPRMLENVWPAVREALQQLPVPQPSRRD